MSKKFVAVCFGALALANAHSNSATPSNNVFVEALINGSATAPMPDDARLESQKRLIQDKTGDSGGLYIVAVRVAKFQQQSRCGRIEFMVSQPSSKIAWRNLGGQINICEDGEPPWQICADSPNRLVPYTAKCANGKRPEDTEEVRLAISRAIAQGGIAKDKEEPATSKKDVKQ